MARWSYEQHLVCYYLDRCQDYPLTEYELVQRLGMTSTESLNMRVRNYKWLRTAGREGLRGSGYSGKQRVVVDYFGTWSEARLREVVLGILDGRDLVDFGVALQEPVPITRSDDDIVHILDPIKSLGQLIEMDTPGCFWLLRDGKNTSFELVSGAYDPSHNDFAWTLLSGRASDELVLCFHPLLDGVFSFRRGDVLPHTSAHSGQSVMLSIAAHPGGEYVFRTTGVEVDKNLLIKTEDLSTELSSHLFPPTLRPKARLMSILGEQLIKDNTIGLMELVKNAYDADAEQVTVGLLNLRDQKQTVVIVEDNGQGMTRSVLLGPFLEPASGHKEHQKRKHLRSPKGRLPLGEKGVGRFAAHRLGRHLRVITRAEGTGKELVLEIDWDAFENENAYLTEVPVTVYERSPMHFVGDKHGTRLEMAGARELWTEADVERLSKQLQRMMSPFEAVSDFTVSLKCPDFPKYEALDPSDLLERAHYHIWGQISEAGEFTYHYRFSVPGLGTRQVSDVADLRKPLKDWLPPARRSSAGPFKVHLYAWDRQLDMLKRSNTTRTELNQRCGVSLFRDGIRVLPYGEPGDDWLGLDQKRIDAPVERIGNKNIIGYVEVNQETNPGLVDKTNREGLIESRALDDLKALVGQAVVLLENLRGPDRPKETKDKEKVPQQLGVTVNDLNQAIQEANEHQSTLRGLIEANRDHFESFPGGQKILRHIERAPKTLSALTAKSTLVSEAATQLQQRFESQRDLLVSLAGFGLAAERFTHEFARLTSEADKALNAVIKENPHLAKSTYLGALRKALDALKNDIRNMGPLFYVRKGAVPVSVDIKDAVDAALRLHRSATRDYRIDVQVQGVPFTVDMREGPCVQVFNNLIDNAIYWVKRCDNADRRIVIRIDSDQRLVTFADSGEGIDPSVLPMLFQPFVTNKQEGRGLGLYIAREIMEESRGQIRLASEEERIEHLQGATFVLEFPPQEAGA